MAGQTIDARVAKNISAELLDKNPIIMNAMMRYMIMIAVSIVFILQFVVTWCCDLLDIKYTICIKPNVNVVFIYKRKMVELIDTFAGPKT